MSSALELGEGLEGKPTTPELWSRSAGMLGLPSPSALERRLLAPDPATALDFVQLLSFLCIDPSETQTLQKTEMSIGDS